MMKIDVEGYEEEVLKGAQGALSNSALMVIELETVSENYTTDADEAWIQKNVL